MGGGELGVVVVVVRIGNAQTTQCLRQAQVAVHALSWSGVSSERRAKRASGRPGAGDSDKAQSLVEAETETE